MGKYILNEFLAKMAANGDDVSGVKVTEITTFRD